MRMFVSDTEVSTFADNVCIVGSVRKHACIVWAVLQAGRVQRGRKRSRENVGCTSAHLVCYDVLRTATV